MKNLIPEFILQKHEENVIKGQFKAASMFIDISGFTAMTQDLMKNGKEGAEILSEIINMIFTPSINSIYENSGFISTFAGDAFTSIFNLETNPEAALNSLNAALQIKKIFNEIGEVEVKFGKYTLSVNIGLAFDTVDWGIIAGKNLYSYYFRGNGIINCIQAQNRAGNNEIILDETIVDKLNLYNFIELRKEEHRFFSLLKINNDKLVSNIMKSDAKETKKFPPKIYNEFIPKIVEHVTSVGEYREIISCFVAFKECKNWQTAISEIIDLADKYDALVMVDDSHAVGFVGKGGRGSHEYCDVLGRVDIITGTLGKALGGASGGFTSGRKETIRTFIKSCRMFARK